MVLESVINPLRAEKEPWLMLLYGALINTVAIVVSLRIFYSESSLLMVFLTVLACSHVMYKVMKREEEKDLEINSEPALLKEHGKALLYLMMLFIGVTISCFLWYLLSSAEISNTLFSTQTQTILKVNSRVTGDFIGFDSFTRILVNNVTVMIYCVASGLIYGFGAIFILMWNASVIGVAMGSFFKQKIVIYAGAIGFAKFAGYIHVGPWSFMRYFFHGIPEILAYVIAGLAGGIVSIALIKGHLSTKYGEKILLDAANLLIISILVLIVAAVMEVYLTPILF